MKKKRNSSRNRSTRNQSSIRAVSKRTPRKKSAASARKRREDRKKKKLRNLILGIFLGFCLSFLIFSVWKLGSMLLGLGSGSGEYKKLKKYVLADVTPPDEVEDLDSSDVSVKNRIDMEALREINPELVGWIEIPDSDISYPVVHTTDNSYYLTHTFRGKENNSGAIFVETGNQPDFSDLHTIIYGYSMSNGSMFAGLKEYEKKAYWEEHPYVYLDLDDGAHCYEIFSCYEASTTDASYTIGYRTNDVYISFLETLTLSSLYETDVEVDENDSVITLSTCTSSDKDRFVVHAKKIY